MLNILISLFIVFCAVEAAVPIPPKPPAKTTPSSFNPQPDPPVAPPPVKSLALPDDEKPKTKTCCELNCPKPAYCSLITPPCGTIPVPTCVCPPDQVWSDCPGCTIHCVELLMGRPCLDVCRPPQCICPEGQLFNSDGKCIPQEKCPRLIGK